MGAKDWGQLAVLSVLWGGSFFFVEVALAGFTPLVLVFGRVAVGAAALGAYLLAVGERWPRDARTWGLLVVMGLLNNVVPFGLIAWGQVRIDGGLASILNATTPLFTVVLAHVLTRDERLTPGRAAGVAFGLAGVVVLVGPDALGGLGGQVAAQIAVLGAACSYAFAGIHGRRLRHLSASVAAAGMLIASTVVLAPWVLVVEPIPPSPPTTAILAILGIGVLSTAVAYILYFRILAAAGPTNLLLVTFLIPVSALGLGAVFLGERPALSAYLGMALVFVGLAAVDGRAARVLRAARL